MTCRIALLVPAVAVSFASLLAQPLQSKPAFPGQTQAPAPAKPSAPVTVETIAGGLTGAWAVAFLPDGNFLVTQAPDGHIYAFVGTSLVRIVPRR